MINREKILGGMQGKIGGRRGGGGGGERDKKRKEEGTEEKNQKIKIKKKEKDGNEIHCKPRKEENKRRKREDTQNIKKDKHIYTNVCVHAYGCAHTCACTRTHNTRVVSGYCLGQRLFLLLPLHPLDLLWVPEKGVVSR